MCQLVLVLPHSRQLLLSYTNGSKCAQTFRHSHCPYRCFMHISITKSMNIRVLIITKHVTLFSSHYFCSWCTFQPYRLTSSFIWIGWDRCWKIHWSTYFDAEIQAQDYIGTSNIEWKYEHPYIRCVVGSRTPPEHVLKGQYVTNCMYLMNA